MVPIDEKPLFMGHKVDALEEITANKLCAILSRSEVKDLVALLFIFRSGIDVLKYMPAANKKDAGLDPSTLAWVLAAMTLELGSLDLLLPVSVDELAAFRDQLVTQLLRLAWPGSAP